MKAILSIFVLLAASTVAHAETVKLNSTTSISIYSIMTKENLLKYDKEYINVELTDLKCTLDHEALVYCSAKNGKQAAELFEASAEQVYNILLEVVPDQEVQQSMTSRSIGVKALSCSSSVLSENTPSPTCSLEY